MTTVPPGAFDDCARLETAAITGPKGGTLPAFASRALSLKAMRNVVNAQEARLAALEAISDKLDQLLARPW